MQKPSKLDGLSKQDQQWADTTQDKLDEGAEIVSKAVDEALDYLQDAIENMGDKQWRKMTIETQAVEMGIGESLAEKVMPIIYDEMRKRMAKKLKIKPETAEVLRHIFMGRVIKNIRRALNERDQ